MPKTIRNQFDKKLTFINLLNAHNRAKKNKTFKKDVLLFEIDLETNLINLFQSIKNNTYKPGKYNQFTIYEPKERIIKALPYKDRIVHQWYIEEFIKPYIVKRFIKDTYACIDNKGAHMASDVVQKYMRLMKRKYPNYYILKFDIKKYFYNINKNILFKILTKCISDKKLLEFTRIILFDDEEDVGIPIGNYTSQYFANIYLNELDQYVKHILKIKYYVRYMDDFILLVPNKEQAIKYKKLIEKFIKEKLELELNHKSRYYPNKMGINFCGYRIFETHKLLRTNSKRKIKKKVKQWNNKYASGTLDIKEATQSLNSWLAHSSHANTKLLQDKIINSIDFLNDKI